MRVIVNELAPDRMRGLFGCFVQINIALGIFVIYSFSLGFTDPEEEEIGPKEVSHSFLWRFAMAVPAILAIIQVALLVFVFHYESPQYYISVGNV